MEYLDVFALHITALEHKLARLQEESARLDARILQLKATTTVPATQIKEASPDGNLGGSSNALLFESFHSKPDATFFKRLGELKLNRFMLSEEAVSVRAAFKVGQTRPWLEVDSSSFTAMQGVPSVPGTLVICNTLEGFKEFDKQHFLNECGQCLLASVNSGETDWLASFACIVHADLKAHRYLYWFGYPSVTFSKPVVSIGPCVLLKDWNPSLFAKLAEFWVGGESFFFCVLDAQIQPISAVKDLKDKSSLDLLGFVDPSTSQNPGWPLRNLLWFAAQHLSFTQMKDLKIVGVRDHITHAMRLHPQEWRGSKPSSSLVWTVNLQQLATEQGMDASRFVGWELNEKGRMGPRLVDLSSLLDPAKLSEAAADLNLRLMKWRSLPQLDESLMAKERVLLLGAGTLGCAVARTLIGWGFRHITFVDQGKVSYSNPVRQSLFEAQDCDNGGKWKAEAAAQALGRIHPAVTARGVRLTIPMPGHPDPELSANLLGLDDLVQSHDTVILLTDTWESRWLPTLLGKAHGKTVLNAALGFDSLVVMRHGGDLGCYFCSDVVAPRDSTRNRTLDQQCTVTRPGLAPIAGALAAELLVGLLHHPQGYRAPAGSSGLLGSLPHQVRMFLPGFETVCISGVAFPECTACSSKVVGAYRTDAQGLVSTVAADPSYLERLTGLDRLNAKAMEGLDEMVEEGDDF